MMKKNVFDFMKIIIKMNLIGLLYWTDLNPWRMNREPDGRSSGEQPPEERALGEKPLISRLTNGVRNWTERLFRTPSGALQRRGAGPTENPSKASEPGDGDDSRHLGTTQVSSQTISKQPALARDPMVRDLEKEVGVTESDRGLGRKKPFSQATLRLSQSMRKDHLLTYIEPLPRDQGNDGEYIEYLEYLRHNEYMRLIIDLLASSKPLSAALSTSQQNISEFLSIVQKHLQTGNGQQLVNRVLFLLEHFSTHPADPEKPFPYKEPMEDIMGILKNQTQEFSLQS